MSDSTRSDGLLPLRCTASRPRPDVCVAVLEGELDMATAPFLGEYLREHTATRPTELVLDLSGVTLLAAAGLALIVTALHNDNDIPGRLHLTGVTGNRRTRTSPRRSPARTRHPRQPSGTARHAPPELIS